LNNHFPIVILWLAVPVRMVSSLHFYSQLHEKGNLRHATFVAPLPTCESWLDRTSTPKVLLQIR